MRNSLFRLSILPAAILLGLNPLQAQAYVFDEGILTFNYDGHNMWGPNSSLVVDHSDFLGYSIPGNTIKSDNIYLGSGADIHFSYGGGDSKIGVGIGAKIDSGDVKVGYSATSQFVLPDATVTKGSYIALAAANASSSISNTLFTNLGSASMYEDFTYKVPVSGSIHACAAGNCRDSSFYNAGAIGPFDIFSYNKDPANPGQVKIFGTTQQAGLGTPISLDANFEIDGVSVGTNLGTVTVDQPTLVTVGFSNNTNGIVSSSNKTELFSGSFDMTDAASLLSGSGATNWNVGADGIDVNITPVALYAQPKLSLEQQFSFDPNLQVLLHFDHIVSAEYSLGAIKFNQTGTDILVAMDNIQNYKFQFNQDTTVTPTYVLNNIFHNTSSLDVGLGLTLTELKGSVSTPGNNFSFDGTSQNLYNTAEKKFTVFDQNYELNFQKITGKSFTILTSGQAVNGKYALWSGLGANDNWSTPENWNAAHKPADGDAIIFNGSQSGRTHAFDNKSFGITTVNGLTFLDGSTSILVDGADLKNTGDIINQSGKLQTITQNLAIANNQHWEGGSGGLNYTGNLVVENGFTLDLKHTQVTTDTLRVGTTTTGTLDASATSKVTANNVIIGADQIGKLVVSDDGTQLTANNRLSIGDNRDGYLYIQSGAGVSANNALFAKASTANAYIGIDGSHSSLTVNQGTIIGESGLTMLRMSNAAGLITGNTDVAINAQSNADLQLQDSKTLWTVNGNLKAGGDGNSRLTLDTGSQLQIQGGLTWGTGTGRSELGLNHSSDAQINGDVTLGNKGIVNVANSSSFAVSGHTTVQAGANLDLMDSQAKLSTGLVIAGNVQSDGISSIAGNIELDAGKGRILNNSGALTLLDDVVHNGADIKTVTGATTIFAGAVHGAGNFSGGGTIDFEGNYAPGNSPAAIHFGGDLLFGSHSNLTLDLFGTTPGKQYDQLLNIGNLNFHGNLVLNFGNFTPEAISMFSLFDFTGFSGVFDPAHIVVNGFDSSKLDFSQLAINGELMVKAVPLPSSIIMLLSGLATMFCCGRKRQGVISIA